MAGSDDPAARVLWWSAPPLRAVDDGWFGEGDDDEVSPPGSRFLLSPDGAWVASTDRATVQVWDLDGGELCWQADVTSRWEPAPLLTGPDGSWLAVANDGLVVHDPRTGAVLWQDPYVFVDALVTAPTAAVLIGTVTDPDHGAYIYVWDAVTGQVRHTWYTTEGLSDDSPDVVVAPDGTWAVTRCDSPGHYGGIWLYDLATGQLRAEFDEGYHDHHLAIAGIAPNSSWMALRSEEGRAVLVWHPAQDRTVTIIEPDREDEDDGWDEDWGISALRRPGRPAKAGRRPPRRWGAAPPVHAISPDSRWLVVGGEIGGVQLHEADTGRLMHRLDTAGAVTSAVIAPDAIWLATLDSDDDSVSIWDATTGQRSRRIAHGNPQASPVITAIATNGDPAKGRLAIADTDELTLWNPHTGHTTAYDLPGRHQTGPPRQIRDLPDGRLAVIGQHGIHIIPLGV
ncbi:WD40 repeat domain-containing protein [Streptomyces sp. NPDC056661]|uniref:WD40 repeat domain-containing protein n=1 Tax=Streptomyces sp. NPDC056661 TaxID=3345898 RepID=UPI003694F5B5